MKHRALHRVALSALLLLSLLLSVGVAGFAAEEPAYGGVLTMAVSADIVTMDPHNTGDIPSFNVQNHVYEELLKWTDDGIGPGLATEWWFSDDDLQLTMKLKEGVVFHDGSPFNAEVVKYNFDRILDPANALRVRSQYSVIKRVEVADEYTVVFHMDEPFGPILAALAAPNAGIISKQALEDSSKDIALNPVGTGPFVFANWTPLQETRVVAFEDYHKGRPYLDEIVFRPIPDAQARLAALEAGDVQVASPIPLQDVERIERSARLRVDSAPTMDNLHMPFNTLRPPFDDVRVRQALNYAVDKDAIVQAFYRGYADPLTDSPVTSAIFGHVATGDYYEYDPARARALLQEAGYANGFAMDVWVPDGRYLEDRRTAEAVAAFLGAVGVRVNLRTFEWGAYIGELTSMRADPVPPYGAVMFTFAVGTRDADRGLGDIYSCGRWQPDGWNMSFYCDDEVESLLVDARHETDPSNRLELYGQAQRILMEDAPAIFLVGIHYVAARSAQVHDIIMDPNGAITLTDAWLKP